MPSTVIPWKLVWQMCLPVLPLSHGLQLNLSYVDLDYTDFLIIQTCFPGPIFHEY